MIIVYRKTYFSISWLLTQKFRIHIQSKSFPFSNKDWSSRNMEVHKPAIEYAITSFCTKANINNDIILKNNPTVANIPSDIHFMRNNGYKNRTVAVVIPYERPENHPYFLSPHCNLYRRYEYWISDNPENMSISTPNAKRFSERIRRNGRDLVRTR